MSRAEQLNHAKARSALLLASPALSRLVTHYAVHPNADLHFHGLKRATGLPNRSLQIELARLQSLGLITRKPDGRLVRYLLQSDEPRWKALRELVRQFVEPAEVLRVALTQVADITAAFVYGSFARRHDVHAESDIDLFVVSETIDQPATRLSLAQEVLEVSGFLDREVNSSRGTHRCSSRGRVSEPSRFVTSVLAGEKEWIVGNRSSGCRRRSSQQKGLRGEKQRRALHRILCTGRAASCIRCGDRVHGRRRPPSHETTASRNRPRASRPADTSWSRGAKGCCRRVA